MTEDKRLSGIGSSEIAAVCGLNKWRSPIDVYMSKLGLVEEQADNDNLWFGRELEPVLIKRYEKETGNKVVVPNPDDLPYRHKTIPWFMFSPDGMVSPDGIVECKTTGMSYLDAWGEPGTDQIPHEYLIQCQWLMEGFGAKWADVPVLFMGARREFRIYRVMRDDELIASLIAKGKEFWENHVIPKIPPDVDASPGWDKYFKKEYPKEEEDVIELLPDNDDTHRLIASYRAEKELVYRFEKIVAASENEIKLLVGNHSGLVGQFGKITWKKSKDRVVTDWEQAFNYVYENYVNEFNDDWEAKDEILKKFTTTNPGPRVFKCYFSTKDRQDETM